MKKKLLSLVLVLAMVCSLFTGVTVSAAAPDTSEFTDMPAVGHWSYNALKAAVEEGLMQGSGGKLQPSGELTRAQMAAITNRAFGATATADISAFTDVKKGAWYYDDMAKAAAMGTFRGSGSLMRPNDPITRQEAFTVLARAYGLADGKTEALRGFSDGSLVSGWAVGPVAAMVSAGYVSGSNGRLNPTGSITRAEFAQVMANLAADYITASGTYTSAAAGNLVVRTGGVTLRDLTVKGDLILADGVGAGSVVLDNVVVTGRILVRGGGSSALSLTNGTTVNSILVNKAAAGVAADKTSSFTTIVVNADNVEIEAKSGSVTAAAGVTGTTVNGEELAAGETVEITASAGSLGGGGPITPSVATTSLVLSAPATALTVGQTDLTLTAARNAGANDSLTWESSNPAVVKVVNGTLHALRVGEAIVSAEANGIISSVTVYVVNPTAASYTIYQSGTVLENCSFDTLTIAENVGAGSVVLNNVTAKKLVVKGGGSNSVEANGGEYDVVEMNSRFNTRLLADGGAIINKLENMQPSKLETGSSGAVIKEISADADLTLKNTEANHIEVNGAELTLSGGSAKEVKTSGTSTLNLNDGGSIGTVQQTGTGSNTTIEGTGRVDKVEASGSLNTNVPVGQIEASGNAKITSNARVGNIAGAANEINLNGSGNTTVTADAQNVKISGEGVPVLSGDIQSVEVEANQSGSTGVAVTGSADTISTTGSGSVKEISVGGNSRPTINAASKVRTVSVTGSAAPTVTGTAGTIISDSTGTVDASGANADQVLATTPGSVSAQPGTEPIHTTLRLQSIAITSLPSKMTYRVDETLDDTGLVVTGYYTADGFNDTLSRQINNYSIDSYSFADGGSKTITVRYGVKEASFAVTVVPKVVDKIVVSQLPVVKTYDLANGTPGLDVSGGELTVYYTSSLYSAVLVNILNAMCSGFSTAEGTHTITVTHESKTAAFNVNVINSDRTAFDLALANAKAEFSSYVTDKLLNNDYSDTGRAAMKKAYADGLTALNALSFDNGKRAADVETTLTAEKAKVDAVKTRSQETDAVVAAFRATYATILGKTVTTVVIGDARAVTAAINAWNGLAAEAQTLLTAEKTLLDNLRVKTDELIAERERTLTLAAAKTAAHEELKEAFSDYEQNPDYSTNCSNIENAKNAGDQAVDAATDQAGVTKALNDALAAMAAFKSDSELNQEAIAAAIEEVNGYLPAGNTWDDYTAAGKARISELREYWAATFDPRDQGGIEQQMASAKAEINAVKTAAQISGEALAAAKAAAKAALNAYGNEALYREAQVTELRNARAAGCTNIDAATTEAAVAAALAGAKTVIDGIKTDEQLTAEELAAAKAEAVAAVLSAKQQADYSEAGWQLIRSTISAAELAIDACTTVTAVTDVRQSALTALNAIVTAVQEHAANVTLLANARTTIESGTYAVQQTTVNTEAQAKAAAETAAAELAGNSGITVAVTGTFTAPVAGTADAPAGTDGSYVFTVKLTAGSSSAGYGSTYAENTTQALTMPISATPYSGTTNEQAVAAAKGRVEAATFAAVACSQASTETAAQAYVKNIAETAVNDSGITVSVNKISYTPGADCSAQADGSDGEYKFTVTLAKGSKSATTAQITVAITGIRHDYTTVVTPPTCTEDGYTTHTCKHCGHSYTDTPVDKLGHIYSAVEYTWAADNSTCTAERTCTRSGCDHTETETVNSSRQTTPATCTVNGKDTYTATFTNAAFAKQTKEITIPATGHTFSTEWSMDETYHWHAATCAHSTEVKDKAEHSWNNGKITEPATGTQSGVKTYTCTVCGQTKTEQIPATNTVVTTFAEFAAALENNTVTGITVNANITVPAGETWTVRDITKPVYVADGKTLTVAAYDAAVKDSIVFNDLVIVENGSLTLGDGAALATVEIMSGANEAFYRYSGRVCVDGGTLDVSRGTVAAGSFLNFNYGDTGTDSTGLILGGNTPGNLEFSVHNEAQLRAAIADSRCTGGVIVENDVALTADLIVTKQLLVNEGKTLTVPAGKSLTVAEGGYLQVSGTVYVYGTLTNEGTILNLNLIDVFGGTLNNGGTMDGCWAGERDDNTVIYSSSIGIEDGAVINNFIDETGGTINDCVVVADYYRASGASRCRWNVLENDHTLDPASQNFDVMAVGFGTAQVQAALNDMTTWAGSTFGTYEYVIACGTDPQNSNVVELGGLTVTGWEALLLKASVFDGTDTYSNTYQISSGMTLTMQDNSGLVMRGASHLDVNGLIEIGEGCWFDKDEDFSLSDNVVFNAEELADAMAVGGTIYLVPFPEAQQTSVQIGDSSFMESQYVLTENMTVSQNTRLIPLGQVAVIAQGDLTVPAELNAECYFIIDGELTVTGSGAMIFRGGFHNTDNGSYGPYAINYQDNDADVTAVYSSYANALAASHEVGMQGDDIAVYPAVEVRCAMTVAGLTINSYDRINVAAGASLTITGELTLGTGEHGAALIDTGTIEVKKGGSLNYGGIQYIGGTDPVFSYDEGEDNKNAKFMLTGLPEGYGAPAGVTGKFLYFAGNFTLNSGMTFTRTALFDRLVVDNVLTVKGTLINAAPGISGIDSIENRSTIDVEGTLTNNGIIHNDFLGTGTIGVLTGGTFTNNGTIVGAEEWDDNGNHWFNSCVEVDFGSTFTNTGSIQDRVQFNERIADTESGDRFVTVVAGSAPGSITEECWAAVVETTAALKRAMNMNRYDTWFLTGDFVLNESITVPEGKALRLYYAWTENGVTTPNSLTVNSGVTVTVNGELTLYAPTTFNGDLVLARDSWMNIGSYGVEGRIYTMNGAVTNRGQLYMDGYNGLGILNINGSYDGGTDGDVGVLSGYGFIINPGPNAQIISVGRKEGDVEINRYVATLADITAAANASYITRITLTEDLTISSDMTIATPLYIAAGKTLTINADVTYRPAVGANDESIAFITIGEGASLVVAANGKLTTESDFNKNIHAQILLNGGTLDASAGALDASIDYRSGTLILPTDENKRFGTEAWRRLYGEDCSEEKLATALADPLVDMIWVRDYMELNGDMTITKQVKVAELDIYGNVTVANGGWLEVQGRGYAAVNRDGSLTVESGGKLVTSTSHGDDSDNGVVYVRGTLTMEAGASVKGVGNQSILHLLYDGGTATIGTLAEGTVENGYIVFNQSELDAALADAGIVYLQINNGNVSYTGNITLRGDLRVSRGHLTINGDLTVNGKIYLTGGDLTVTGDLTENGGAEVGSGSQNYSSLTVGGDLIVNSDMDVYGESQESGATVTVTGDLVKADGAAVILSAHWDHGFVGYNCTFTADNIISDPNGVASLLTNGDGGRNYYLTYFQGSGCYLDADFTLSHDVTLNVLDSGVWVEIRRNLTVAENVTLTIGDGLTFAVDGTVTNNGTVMQIGGFFFSEENYSGTGSVYSPMALRELARTVYWEFGQYPGLIAVDPETEWYNFDAGYDTILNWKQFLNNCFNNEDYDAILGMAMLIENDLLTGEHYAFEAVDETLLKSVMTAFVNKVNAPAAAKTKALGNINAIDLYGEDNTLFRGWYDSDSDSFRYQNDEVIRTLRNDLGLYSVEVTTEAELLAALNVPYVTGIHVPQDMTILGMPDSNDTHFDGCCYLNADGRNVEIYLHGVTTLTVGDATHNTKLDVGSGVKIMLVQIEDSYAKIVVNEGSCINVFGELSVSGPWQQDDYFTGNISYFGDTYYFGEQLLRTAGQYMNESLENRLNPGTRSAYQQMSGWDGENNRFTKLVAYGLTPETSGSNAWWQPWQPLTYGQMRTILTNVYRAAYQDDTLELPASVYAGNGQQGDQNYWRPSDGDFLNNDALKTLLYRFKQALPRTQVNGARTFTLERKLCDDPTCPECGQELHEFVSNNHDTCISDKEFKDHVTINNVTSLSNENWGGGLSFENCRFDVDVTIIYNPACSFEVRFEESCEFAEGVKVNVVPVNRQSGPDASFITGCNVSVRFACSGGEVTASAPTRAMADNQISFLFNGVTVSGTSSEHYDYSAELGFNCTANHDNSFDWNANDHSGCNGGITPEYKFCSNGDPDAEHAEITVSGTPSRFVNTPIRLSGIVNASGLVPNLFNDPQTEDQRITLHLWNGWWDDDTQTGGSWPAEINIGANTVYINDGGEFRIAGTGTVYTDNNWGEINGLRPHIFGWNSAGIYLNLTAAPTNVVLKVNGETLTRDDDYTVTALKENGDVPGPGEEAVKVHILRNYDNDDARWIDNDLYNVSLTFTANGLTYVYEQVQVRAVQMSEFRNMLLGELDSDKVDFSGYEMDEKLTYGAARDIALRIWTAYGKEGYLPGSVRLNWDCGPGNEDTLDYRNALEMAERLFAVLGVRTESVSDEYWLCKAMDLPYVSEIYIVSDMTITGEYDENDDNFAGCLYMNRPEYLEDSLKIYVNPGVTLTVGNGTDDTKLDIYEGVDLILVEGENNTPNGKLVVNDGCRVNVFGGLNWSGDGDVIGYDNISIMQRMGNFGARVYDRLLNAERIPELTESEKATPVVDDCWPDNEWDLNGMAFLVKYAGLTTVADGDRNYWPTWDWAKYGQAMALLGAIYNDLTDGEAMPASVGLDWDPDPECILDNSSMDSLIDSFMAALPRVPVVNAAEYTLERKLCDDESCDQYEQNYHTFVNGEHSTEVSGFAFEEAVTVSNVSNLSDDADDPGWGGEMTFRNCSFAEDVTIIYSPNCSYKVQFDASCAFLDGAEVHVVLPDGYTPGHHELETDYRVEIGFSSDIGVVRADAPTQAWREGSGSFVFNGATVTGTATNEDGFSAATEYVCGDTHDEDFDWGLHDHSGCDGTVQVSSRFETFGNPGAQEHATVTVSGTLYGTTSVVQLSGYADISGLTFTGTPDLFLKCWNGWQNEQTGESGKYCTIANIGSHHAAITEDGEYYVSGNGGTVEVLNSGADVNDLGAHIYGDAYGIYLNLTAAPTNVVLKVNGETLTRDDDYTVTALKENGEEPGPGEEAVKVHIRENEDNPDARWFDENDDIHAVALSLTDNGVTVAYWQGVVCPKTEPIVTLRTMLVDWSQGEITEDNVDLSAYQDIYYYLTYGTAMDILRSVWAACVAGESFPDDVCLNWAGDEDTLDYRATKDLVNQMLDAMPATLSAGAGRTSLDYTLFHDENDDRDYIALDGGADNGNMEVRSTTFLSPVTVTCTDDSFSNDCYGGAIRFKNCVFTGDVTVNYSDEADFAVEFDDSCTFASGVEIYVVAAGGVDLRGNRNLGLRGVKDAVIVAAAPCGASTGDGNSFTFNGVTAAVTIDDDGADDQTAAVNLRYDCSGEHDDSFDWDSNDHSNCLLADGETPAGSVAELQFNTGLAGYLTVTGTAAEGCIRVEGCVDVSGLTAQRINLSDWNCGTEAAIGTNTVYLVDARENGYTVTGSGTVILDNNGAKLTLNGVYLGCPCVEYDGSEYQIYLGARDLTDVSITLTENGSPVPFTPAALPDDQTYGYSLVIDGANVEDSQNLRMEITIGGATVVYDPVPSC